MVTSNSRGHQIYYDGVNWRYTDTNEIENDSRPCVRCGCFPNQDGSDHCLGYIEGAISACCGHGVEEPYIIYDLEHAKKTCTVMKRED